MNCALCLVENQTKNPAQECPNCGLLVCPAHLDICDSCGQVICAGRGYVYERDCNAAGLETFFYCEACYNQT
jgi:hypothetical protein